ncbi:hypothetical protein D3C87_1450800 [compost metagenome]
MLEQLSLSSYGVTAEQVSNVYFLNIIDLDSTTRQIHETRHTSNMQRKTFKEREDLTATASVGRRNRKKDLLSTGNVDHSLDLLGIVDMQA